VVTGARTINPRIDGRQDRQLAPPGLAEGRAAVERALRVLEDPALQLMGEWDSRMHALAVGVATVMGDPVAAFDLRAWGRYHDVGKVYCLDVLVQSGPLDEEQQALMQEHPVLGAGLLRRAGLPEAAMTLAALHHERIDGSGYPFGISDLPCSVRALQVADIYCALRSERIYKRAWTHGEAMTELHTERVRGRLCPDAVDALTTLFS
jgi:putative two-component system response regulator